MINIYYSIINNNYNNCSNNNNKSMSTSQYKILLIGKSKVDKLVFYNAFLNKEIEMNDNDEIKCHSVKVNTNKGDVILYIFDIPFDSVGDKYIPHYYGTDAIICVDKHIYNQHEAIRNVSPKLTSFDCSISSYSFDDPSVYINYINGNGCSIYSRPIDVYMKLVNQIDEKQDIKVKPVFQQIQYKRLNDDQFEKISIKRYRYQTNIY